MRTAVRSTSRTRARRNEHRTLTHQITEPERLRREICAQGWTYSPFHFLDSTVSPRSISDAIRARSASGRSQSIATISARHSRTRWGEVGVRFCPEGDPVCPAPVRSSTLPLSPTRCPCPPCGRHCPLFAGRCPVKDGGGGGNRTPVPKSFQCGFYEHSPSFDLTFRAPGTGSRTARPLFGSPCRPWPRLRGYPALWPPALTSREEGLAEGLLIRQPERSYRSQLKVFPGV